MSSVLDMKSMLESYYNRDDELLIDLIRHLSMFTTINWNCSRTKWLNCFQQLVRSLPTRETSSYTGE
ncbi:unnamed protein product [Litomosoides sigmodontis]|uniref:Uncharacterized protein n=1 Tax=Litomosoides sigmodontis TaxID=42156 RepID=A0A3P6TIM2_LITSI|nr:unnamed protein product [Litomosoides sigmodontis]